MSAEELNSIIAGNIKALRSGSGMTQSELAQKLNYTDKLVSKWERGESAPGVYTLKQLAEIFGVSTDYLLTDHENEEGPGTGKIVGEKPKLTPEEAWEKHKTIIFISLCGVFLAAVLLFVILWTAWKPVYGIFAYILPVAAVLLLVLNSVWNKGKHNFIIIGALVAFLILTVYVALFMFNLWQIFFLLIPAELLVWLCSLLKKKTRPKPETRSACQERSVETLQEGEKDEQD